MSARIMRSLCLILVSVSIICVSLGQVQAADVRSLTPSKGVISPSVRSSDVSVRSVTPSDLVLLPGGSPMKVTLSGTGLDKVTGVQVLENGRVSTAITAQWTRGSASDLPVNLTAGNAAPAGTYTLRLLTGQLVIDVSVSIASVLVETAPSISPGPSSHEIKKAASPVRAPGTVFPSQKTAQELQAVSNLMKAQNDASKGVIDNMKGGSTSQETGESAEPAAAAGSTGTEGLPPPIQSSRSVRKIQPPGNSAITTRSVIEIPKMEAPGNLGPHTLEGPMDATSPEAFAYRFDKSTAGAITGAVFNRAVRDVLFAARFHSNSCGGTWEVRRITIDIPNTYYNDGTSLSRLDYELTDKESDETEWTVERPLFDQHFRIKEIRACVDDWLGNAWTGRVEDGAFKIYLAHAADRNIKTRALANRKSLTPGWSSDAADGIMPDYNLGNSPLEITLTPAFNDGVLTYTSVDARWTSLFGEFSKPPRIQFKRLVGMILDYRAAKLEEIRQRTINLFNDASVRNRISEALTAQVLGNQFVNRIIALTGGTGEEVAYRYE